MHVISHIRPVRIIQFTSISPSIFVETGLPDKSMHLEDTVTSNAHAAAFRGGLVIAGGRGILRQDAMYIPDWPGIHSAQTRLESWLSSCINLVSVEIVRVNYHSCLF